MSQNVKIIMLSKSPVMILLFKFYDTFSILDYSEVGWNSDILHDEPPKVL